MHQPPERRLTSIAKAAQYAAVSPLTIRRRVATGTIRGYRLGPRILRVDLNEIDDALLRPIPTTGGNGA